MKKTLTAFVLIVLVASLASAGDLRSVSGGTARNISMGGGPLNPYLLDGMRVHTNPALLAKYSNFAWGDLGYLAGDVPNGGGRNQYFTAGLSVMDNLSVGVSLNRRESPLYNVDATNPARDPIGALIANAPLPAPLAWQRPMSPVEVMASFSLDDMFQLGLAISLAGANDKNELPSPGGTQEVGSRFLGIKAGVNLELMEELVIDGAVLFRMNSFKYTNSATGASPSEIASDNGVEIGIDGRMRWELDKTWTLVPVVRFYTFGWGAKITPAPASPIPNPPITLSHTELEVGVGLNYSTEKVLLAGGLSMQSVSSKFEDKSVANTTTKVTNTELDFPKLNMGIEFSLTDWLVVRGGYFKRLSSDETKTEVTTTAASTTRTRTISGELPYYGDPNALTQAQQTISMGVGLHFGGFSFDGTMGEGYWINGPWVMSGVTQNMFGMVSMHYYW